MFADYLYWLIKESCDKNNLKWYESRNGDYVNISKIDKLSFLKYGANDLCEYIDLEGDIFDVTKEDVKIDVSNMEEVETELEAGEPVVEEDEVEETEAEAEVDEVDEIKVEEVKAEEPEVEEVKTEEPKDLENTDDSLIDLELDF